tara:strand:- start:766 stop:1095 length:330 start_codon:yes stop_codon:yes gene_type:complete
MKEKNWYWALYSTNPNLEGDILEETQDTTLSKVYLKYKNHTDNFGNEWSGKKYSLTIELVGWNRYSFFPDAESINIDFNTKDITEYQDYFPIKIPKYIIKEWNNFKEVA